MLGALGEPAHVARVFVGRNVNDPGTGRVLRRVPVQTIRRAIDKLIREGRSGGFTAYTAAEGRYGQVNREGRTHYFPREPTTVLELVTSARDSCRTVTRRAKAVGAELAKSLKQDSVLVVTSCARGGQDAEFVDREGRATFPLPKLPKVRAHTPTRRSGHRR